MEQAQTTEPTAESSDDEKGYESDPEKEIELMAILEAKIERYEASLGMDHEKTLNKIFTLLNLYIQHYKLDIMDKLLEKITDVCSRDKTAVWYIKYIQMLGFCRWKQYRLKEALALFLEQESLIGDNSILCENIGHTYSSMGDYQKARESFLKGLTLLGPDGAPGRQAGFYYGLGLATDRLGSTEEALPMVCKALEGYRKERVDPQGIPVDSSIHAKVQSSIGHLQEKLGNNEEAMKMYTEAVRVFLKTTGPPLESPLTTTAMGSLGKLKLKLGDGEGAQPFLKHSLDGEVAKNAFQVDDTFGLVNLIKELHTTPIDGKSMSLPELNVVFSQYVPVLEKAVERCQPLIKTAKNGDVAALFKTIGEVLLLAGHVELAISILSQAVMIFKEVTQIDCTGLIEGCNQLITIAVQMCGKKPDEPAAGPAPAQDTELPSSSTSLD
eukprot:TRINITY_DN12862_c0_g1_i3.p1 TRINITY_DN12862_c0_g1~~TRINITY_DN12862_c0_g1_i3.p1  ORF type:complete len:440 (-),score=94.38 TRINITY_DN12862_c0_g1_i3:133-1452(-)